MLLVALFTRAWIEIIASLKAFVKYTVALFTRAWIEIGKSIIALPMLLSRPLHEGVD